MKHDESSKSRDNSGLNNLDQLNRVFAQMMENYEHSREKIFVIAQECYRQCTLAEGEKEKLKSESCLDIEKQILLLDERLDILRTAANKAEKLLINTGLAMKIIEEDETILQSAPITYAQQQMLIKSRESERSWIAREIHDGPAQSLASVLINLDLMEQMGLNDINKTYKEIQHIKAMGRKSLLELRHIIFDLKPLFLKEGPFSLILRDYFKDYKVRYNFNVNFIASEDIDNIGYSLRLVFFRLIQEAINNAREHSGVNKALVEIENDKKFITLMIKDEGIGFDLTKAELRERYGISGMKERVEIFKGEIQIVSSPGSGTRVIIKVPSEREDKQI